jgi:hypothetical protein
MLKKLFKVYAAQEAFVGSRSTMSFGEYIDLVEACNLATTSEEDDGTQRVIRMAFTFSLMPHVDEHNTDSTHHATFTDFLEVLARLAHGNILGKKAADHNLTSISPLSAKLAVLLTTLDEHASSPEVKRMQKL